MDVRYGAVESYSDHHITVRAGSYTGTYTGDFSYDVYGNVFGVVEGYRNAYRGNVYEEFTGLRIDAYRTMQYINNEDPALYRYALRGADTFELSRYRDFVWSHAGNDVVRANDGDDYVDGGTGSDRIFAGSGADTVVGGDGNDRIYSGSGKDYLLGGLGYDDFVFERMSDAGLGASKDTIASFRSGVDDIDLRMIDANIDRGGDQAFNFIGSRDFTDRAGQLRYVDGVLQADVDGDGGADFAISLQGSPSITAADILL
jgi:Ca2+-binding RTX toxin-like protein